MAELIIYGASDDLVEFEGVFSEEYSGIGAEGKPLYFEVTDTADEGYLVAAIYGRRGCWTFAAGLLDEGMNLPDWDLRVEKYKDYSASLHFYNCPAEIRVRLVGKGHDEDNNEVFP